MIYPKIFFFVKTEKQNGCCFISNIFLISKERLFNKNMEIFFCKMKQYALYMNGSKPRKRIKRMYTICLS